MKKSIFHKQKEKRSTFQPACNQNGNDVQVSETWTVVNCIKCLKMRPKVNA